MAIDPRRKGSDFTGVFSVILSLQGGNNVILNNKDIVECYFIEDIFSYCMTGKITFFDMYGLTEYGPITGNEQLVIAYGNENDRQCFFDIWKMKKVAQSNPSSPTSQSLIEMYFVDPIFELYSTSRYSRSWQDEKVTDIIKHILKNMVNRSDTDLDIEESSNNIDFVMPYWTPMRAIRWLMQKAISNEMNTSGYLCYNRTSEKTKNGYVISMHTLNHLLSQNAFLEEDTYFFEERGLLKKNKILDWWFNGIDKHSTSNLKGGQYKGYKFFGKEFINNSYTYSGAISDSMLLGKKSLFTDISNENASVHLLGDNDETLIESQFYNDWIKRYSIQNVLNIIVRGHETRYAGKQIELEWTSSEKKTQIFNKQLKGKYLIKSVTHSFAGHQADIPYRQRLVLIKNAYEDSDHRYLVKSTNRNLYTSKQRIRTIIGT